MVTKVKSEYVKTGTLYHNGFIDTDYRQDIVRYAYDKGGMDLLILMECESGMNPLNIGDYGRAYGLCQNNSNYRVVSDKYKKDRKEQVDVCYDLRKNGTPFYGPDRPLYKDKAHTIYLGLCKDVVVNRFIRK